MKFTIADGVRAETVDDGLLVLRPGETDVLHLTGTDAEAFEVARPGIDVVPERLHEPMAGLVELGVVHTTEWSRRRVLQLGGAAAAATVAVIALPNVAAADSPGDPGGPTTGSATITLRFWDGTKEDLRPALPADVPANTYQAEMFSNSTGTGTPVSTTYVGGSTGDEFITFTFTGVAPGTYWVDIDEPFATVGNDALDTAVPGNVFDLQWNVPYEWSQTPPITNGATPNQPWPRYQKVTVTAGDTTTLELDLQLRIVPAP